VARVGVTEKEYAVVPAARSVAEPTGAGAFAYGND
jgi:hypothetical protein